MTEGVYVNFVVLANNLGGYQHTVMHVQIFVCVICKRCEQGGWGQGVGDGAQERAGGVGGGWDRRK